LQMFQNWCERLELKENRCGFSPVGVVWIGGENDPQSIGHFHRVGAAGGVYTVEQLRDRYPSLNFCAEALDMTGRAHDCTDPPDVFWESDGGFADPQGTTEDLLRAGTSKGVELFVRHEVVRIEPETGNGFRAIHCANGAVFGCKLLLNAAGPWCQQVNQMVGVTLPMRLRPTRVQIAIRDRPTDVVGDIPVFISAADQVYGRPEAHGQQFIVGSTAPADECEPVDDPDEYDTRSSPEFREKMMHKLHHRFAMQSRGTVGGYAALYTVNTDDWHPIIDAVGPDGYFVANGFSGHGFKLGPAVGALIGRMMTGIELADDPPVNSKYFAADRQPIVSSGGVLG
jgi:glycine/D-amino acid oxidase-like deaminating enzyme